MRSLLRCILALVALASPAASQGPPPGPPPELLPPDIAKSTDLKTANGVRNIVVPKFISSGALQFISPSTGDASLVLRHTALELVAIYDAVAPYHPTAVGIYSRFKRQPPPPKDDNTIVNTALVYACYQFFNWNLPQFQASWREMLTEVRTTGNF